MSADRPSTLPDDPTDVEDLHGLLIAVARRWAEKYHPDAEHVTVLAEFGPGSRPVSVPVVTHPACGGVSASRN